MASPGDLRSTDSNTRSSTSSTSTSATSSSSPHQNRLAHQRSTSGGRLDSSDWKRFVSTAKKVHWNGFKNNLLLQAVDRYSPRPIGPPALIAPPPRTPSSQLHSRGTSTDASAAVKVPLPPPSRPALHGWRPTSRKSTPHESRPDSPDHPFRSRSTPSRSSGKRSSTMSSAPSVVASSTVHPGGQSHSNSDTRSVSATDTDSLLTVERFVPNPDNTHAASKRLGINLDVTRQTPTDTQPPPTTSAAARLPPQTTAFAAPYDTAIFEAQPASAREQFMNQFTFRPASPSVQTLTDQSVNQEPTVNPDQITFYSSESEDEEEGGVSHSSPRYSTRSSRTSYGVASPHIDDNAAKFGYEDGRWAVSDQAGYASPRQGPAEAQRQHHVQTQRASTQLEKASESAHKPPARQVSHKSGARNFSRPSVSESPMILRRASSEEERASRETLEAEAKKHKQTKKSDALKVISGTERRSARPLSLAVMKESESVISADAAETVILHIFESVDEFRDLFCLARINRGFYNVFKTHELALMKNTLHNISPPAWELREASPKEIIAAAECSKADYTPTLYMQFHTRDLYVVSALKSAMFSRCQQHLRAETIAALRERGTRGTSRVNDALWRIWTFCTVFGPDRGGEFDLEAQMHWLRGGVTRRDSCRQSSVASSSRAQSSRSTTSATYFGRGNVDGLTLDELYDMEEMWNCIKALLRGVLGQDRILQAREHGVFDDQKVDKGDPQAEECLLEEWMHYLATLGLSTVVDLSTHLDSRTDSLFIAAKDMEWTTWSAPPQGVSRGKFLLEAVSRVYDERLPAAQINGEPGTDEMKARRRSKRVSLAIEIKNERKKSVDWNEMALGEDKPMSLWVQWINKLEPPTMTHTPPTPTTAAPVEKPPLASAAQKPAAPSPSRAPARSPIRSRASSGTLSLIPPEYRNNVPGSSPRATPSATPRMSPVTSPQRSRASSLRSIDVAHAQAHARQTPRASRRPSLLRAGSNPMLNDTLTETLFEEPAAASAPAADVPPRPATAHAAESETVMNPTPPLRRPGSGDALPARPSTAAAAAGAYAHGMQRAPKSVLSRIPRRPSARALEA